MMTPFEVYKIYVALKSHFGNKSYDYKKYNGKTNAKYETFCKRKDKYFFFKISKKYNNHEVEGFLISNMISDPSEWVGNLILNESQSQQTFNNWRRRQESQTQSFIDEFKSIFDVCAEKKIDFKTYLFGSENATHSEFIKDIARNNIAPETYIIMDRLFDLHTVLDSKYSSDLHWQQQSKMLGKYKAFVEYDIDKII